MKQEILRALQTTPFAPFTVALSDGQSYKVTHPEAAMLSESGLYLHLGDDQVVRVALLHITQVRTQETSHAG